MNRNHEVARKIAHTAIHIAGIPDIQKGDVDKLHRCALIIKHPSYQLLRFLLDTLEIDLILVEGGTDGIKANYLGYDITNILVLERSTDGEILQLIVDKIDFILGLSLV